MSIFRTLPINTQGQDYFVGDLHGHYAQLMQALEERRFDFSRDRLISVGDLVDRGPDSELCIDLLNRPWFHACLGNHEWMMIGAYLYGDSMDLQLQRNNGGEWMDQHDIRQLREWALFLKESCPLAIEVPQKQGRIGVVHSEVLREDWRNLKTASARQIDRCVWPRERFLAALEGADLVEPIRHIDVVVSGHNAYTRMIRAANQLYIDTLWRGGKLTVLSAREVLATVGK